MEHSPLHRGETTTRDGNDALGLPAAAEPRHAAGDERPQHGKPLLARLAQAGVPLPGAGDGVLRVHRQPSENPILVRLGDDRELFAFAGIWRPWTDTRKGETGEHLLFAFLTTEPNEVVRPVHSKAMPVILAGAACDVWLEASAAEALKLQQPWPADHLAIVAIGQRQDDAA